MFLKDGFRGIGLKKTGCYNSPILNRFFLLSIAPYTIFLGGIKKIMFRNRLVL